MRRRGGLLASLALVVAACTSGGDGAPPTRPPAASTTTESSSTGSEPAPDATDAGAPGTTDAAATAARTKPSAGRPDGPVLPGLIETGDEPLPDDEAVRTGVLDNGLTYFVRSNDNPGAKVTLRLAIRAGSVNELSDVTGLAHFAEHMLFNGTEKFPENELIDVLRSFGADFGPDVNAYTSFDETVYMLVVPNDAESVALGIDVLREWLSNATIADEEVVKERGVVLDEWRVRTQTTQGRLSEIAQGVFLAGSAYDGRSPIGNEDSISNMPTDDVREYYDAWYRPDNAAIIVVGDIDADRIAEDVRDEFGSVAARTPAAPERPDLSFDLEDEPDFGLHVDPDQQTVDVEISLPIPADTGTGTASARLSFIDSMIYEALIRRLDQDRAAGVAPFDQITRGGNSFVETLDAPALYAFTDEARVVDTLSTLLDEYARAFEYGFTPAETDLARQSQQSFLDTRFDGRNSRQDTDIADALVEAFLRGASYPTIADEYRVLSEVLTSIAPEELDERFRARWANTAPHVIISTPEAVAGSMPTRDEVLEIVADAYDRPIEPRAALRDLPDSLMARPDSIVPISEESLLSTGIPIFDPVEVMFPNGVTVIYTPNTIVEGQVYFTAVSPGGSSLVADEDVIDAYYAADVVTGGGLADFNQAELAQVNADADVSVSASISPYEDSFGGQAATSDVEVLMQMLHLYFTRPRFDPVALDRVRSFEEAVVDDPGSDPERVATAALHEARYPGEPRYTVLPSPAEFATLDLDGVERVWRDRHADAGDWTFVFAGDFDADQLVDLAGSYLATLPATNADEGFVDVSVAPPTEPVVVSREAGTGDTATVTLLFTTPASGDLVADRVEADIASAVLDARLTDVVREELGDSYSPFVATYLTTDPQPVIETFARITGSPDRVDAIADVVLGEFADLAGGGMTGDEYDRALSLISEQYNFVNNNLFLEGLSTPAVFPEVGIDSFVDRFDELGDVDQPSITEFIAEHLPLDRYVQVTVVPR